MGNFIFTAVVTDPLQFSKSRGTVVQALSGDTFTSFWLLSKITNFVEISLGVS